MNLIHLENNFFGRKTILDLLTRRVIDLKEGYRQNLAFLGDRFIGKSFLLQKFSSSLEDSDIIEIYVDLDHKDFYYFFHKMAGCLLYGFCKSKKLPLDQDLNLLLENAKKYIPQTVEEIKRIRTNLLKGKVTESYRDLISLPQVFTVESGKFCMIILDEFHNLENFGIPEVFRDLGKSIMTQRRCIYIVTSSLNGLARTILSEKLSLLFGHFEILNITPFDVKTSREFIEHNLKEIRMQDPLKNFLIDFTGGHPFYLSLICQEMLTLSAIHQQEEVFLPLMTQAIENILFNRWGILSRHFELTLETVCEGKGNRSVAGVLIALSKGQHKVKELADKLGLPKALVAQKINRLVDLGIVAKNGNFFFIEDRLLKYWIEYVFEKRLTYFRRDCASQTEQFRQEIERLVNHFYSVSHKDLSSRIIELFQCFDNDAFDINGRKYRLPAFDTIGPVRLKDGVGDNFNVLKASGNTGDWFIILKDGQFAETDVNAFLAESKQQGRKAHQQVIISLNDLDVNVRLRALQEKMWIWNEAELNTLLNFYDKPYIVK